MPLHHQVRSCKRIIQSIKTRFRIFKFRILFFNVKPKLFTSYSKLKAMVFSRKKQINYLSLVPVGVVKEFTEENGRITLLIPKFKHPFFQRFFIPKHKSPHFRIHLDELGSLVWKQIDGKKNVEQICSGLAGSINPDSIPDEGQLESRVTKFLTELYKNRFVKLEESNR